MTNKIHIYYLILLTIVSHNCSAAPSDIENLENARISIYTALQSQKILDLDRQLVHLSYVCSLTINQKKYPVIDLQENMRSSTTPRGVNNILILDDNLKLVNKFEYTRERPLFCAENKLFIFGNIQIEGVSGMGNVIVFEKNHLELQNLEASDYPLPITRYLSK